MRQMATHAPDIGLNMELRLQVSRTYPWDHTHRGCWNAIHANLYFLDAVFGFLDCLILNMLKFAFFVEMSARVPPSGQRRKFMRMHV
jgi:hypothetical protein